MKRKQIKSIAKYLEGIEEYKGKTVIFRGVKKEIEMMPNLSGDRH